MNHKQQIAEMQRKMLEREKKYYANQVLRNQLSCILLILGDKYGFGKKRMSDFLEHLANYTLSYKLDAKAGINTSCEDVENVLRDEYKLDMEKVMDEIIEKNKELI